MGCVSMSPLGALLQRWRLAWVVVAGPAQVGVIYGRRWHGSGFRLLAVQVVFENRLQASVVADVEGEGAPGGGFHPLVRVVLAQPDDAQTRPVALFGMAVGAEDAFDHLGRGRADRAAPLDDARRRPLLMPLVRLRPVLMDGRVLVGGVRAGMRGQATVPLSERSRKLYRVPARTCVVIADAPSG